MCTFAFEQLLRGSPVAVIYTNQSVLSTRVRSKSWVNLLDGLKPLVPIPSASVTQDGDCDFHVEGLGEKDGPFIWCQPAAAKGTLLLGHKEDVRQEQWDAIGKAAGDNRELAAQANANVEAMKQRQVARMYHLLDRGDGVLTPDQWTVADQAGRKKYSTEFMLRFKHVCTEPRGLRTAERVRQAVRLNKAGTAAWLMFRGNKNAKQATDADRAEREACLRANDEQRQHLASAYVDAISIDESGSLFVPEVSRRGDGSRSLLANKNRTSAYDTGRAASLQYSLLSTHAEASGSTAECLATLVGRNEGVRTLSFVTEATKKDGEQRKTRQIVIEAIRNVPGPQRRRPAEATNNVLVRRRSSLHARGYLKFDWPCQRT